MKKLLIALPFVAGAAAIAGTSQYAGNQTKSEYHQLLAQLNDLSPLVFVNEQYEAGIVTSSAVTKVMSSRTADAELLFRLQHDIKHAPVRMGDQGVSLGTVNINTRLHDEISESSEFAALFADNNVFTLNTDVKYTGEINNQLRVNALEVSEEGETFTWSGMSFNGVTKDGATVGNGSMGSVKFIDENTGGMMSFADSQIDLDIQHHGDNIYTGSGDMKFDNVSFLSPELPVPVTLTSFEVNSSTEIQDAAMSGGSRISLNGIESDLPVNNASLDIQVEGLMIEGLRQYNKVMAALNDEPENLLGDSELGAGIANALRDMFAPGSALTYAVALENSDGDVNADLRLALKDESEEGMGADALNNVVTGRDLLNILTLDGMLDADTEALAQTPLMMMLGGAGEFISVTDESITSRISLNGTTLLVNGVELPLDLMSGGMLDIPFSDLFQM